MPIKLWSTFRLKRDATYDTRYAAMVKAFNEAGTNFWEETTSFVAFDTTHTIDQVAAHVKAAINPQTDLLVFRQVVGLETRYVGVLEKPTAFFSHFPGAKKV